MRCVWLGERERQKEENEEEDEEEERTIDILIGDGQTVLAFCIGKQ